VIPGVVLGWDSLLRELFTALTEIERIAPGTVRIIQVKQKFGYLRVYLESGNPDTYALIDAAGKASGYICEGCGCHSTISSRGGWLTTLCDDCFSRTK
jgi:hypothetical protein